MATYREVNGKSIDEAFEAFHKKNPRVYEEFKKQITLALSKGKRKISAKLIINWIRWNVYMETEDEVSPGFSVNDAYQSRYARLFVEEYPHHKDLFNFRELRS